MEKNWFRPFLIYDYTPKSLYASMNDEYLETSVDYTYKTGV